MHVTKQELRTEDQMQEKAELEAVGETALAEASEVPVEEQQTEAVLDVVSEEEEEVSEEQSSEPAEAALEEQPAVAQSKWQMLSENQRIQFIVNTFAYSAEELFTKSLAIAQDAEALPAKIDEQTVISAYNQMAQLWNNTPNPPLEQLLPLETLLDDEKLDAFVNERVLSGFRYRHSKVQVSKDSQSITEVETYSSRLENANYKVEIDAPTKAELILSTICYLYTYSCLPLEAIRESIKTTYELLPHLDWNKDIYPVLVSNKLTYEDYLRLTEEATKEQDEQQTAEEAPQQEVLADASELPVEEQQTEAALDVVSEVEETVTPPSAEEVAAVDLDTLPVGQEYDALQDKVVTLPETAVSTGRTVVDSTGADVRTYLDDADDGVEFYYDRQLGKLLF